MAKDSLCRKNNSFEKRKRGGEISLTKGLDICIKETRRERVDRSMYMLGNLSNWPPFIADRSIEIERD